MPTLVRTYCYVVVKLETNESQVKECVCVCLPIATELRHPDWLPVPVPKISTFITWAIGFCTQVSVFKTLKYCF
jgi:hypothetical protein